MPSSSVSASRSPLRRIGRRLRRFGAPALVGGLAILLYASPFVTAHGSMRPTLRSGDVLLVDRLTPAVTGFRRGDLVVFVPPGLGERDVERVYVKRVVGLPGEHVVVLGGHVWVDGLPVAEPYVPGSPPELGPAEADVVVPAGMLFVLGDNRGHSYDSRGFGPVPAGQVIGRVWAAVPTAEPLTALSRAAAGAFPAPAE